MFYALKSYILQTWSSIMLKQQVIYNCLPYAHKNVFQRFICNLYVGVKFATQGLPVQTWSKL